MCANTEDPFNETLETMYKISPLADLLTLSLDPINVLGLYRASRFRV